MRHLHLIALGRTYMSFLFWEMCLWYICIGLLWRYIHLYQMITDIYINRLHFRALFIGGVRLRVYLYVLYGMWSFDMYSPRCNQFIFVLGSRDDLWELCWGEILMCCGRGVTQWCCAPSKSSTGDPAGLVGRRPSLLIVGGSLYSKIVYLVGAPTEPYHRRPYRAARFNGHPRDDRSR